MGTIEPPWLIPYRPSQSSQGPFCCVLATQAVIFHSLCLPPLYEAMEGSQFESVVTSRGECIARAISRARSLHRVLQSSVPSSARLNYLHIQRKVCGSISSIGAENGSDSSSLATLVARITQLRRELQCSWQAFQSEATTVPSTAA